MDSDYFKDPRSRWMRQIKRFPLVKKWIADWTPPDHVETPHNVGFAKSKNFSDAYQAAVTSCGFDYRIPWRVHQAIWAAHNACKVKGDFVELGTGKGFIMKAVLSSMDWNRLDKTCLLYDLFKSFYVSGRGNDKHDKYYASSIEQVIPSFEEFQRVHLIEGDVLETINENPPNQVSFMHVDLNDADTEIKCIEQLWPKITSGGVVLLDDYANRGHEHQYKKLNELFAELARPVLTVPAGQGIVIK